ncbi:MAG: cytochrome c3 family protein [Anaerolineales bacterium]|nr:cytochrome c3 family protein [Anaerolineales bacterium]
MMSRLKHNPQLLTKLVFVCIFLLFVLLGAAAGYSQPASAAPAPHPASQATGYAGSQACGNCHKDIHANWQTTRHALAFSSPIFQQDWTKLGSRTTCLACHTTGYDPNTGNYVEEGVTCESCHGAFQPDHPEQPMPVKPNADLCATCHKTSTDEWRASPHVKAGIQCQACHDPHSQTPKAESVTALCTNCHKDMGEGFTHGTHASAGLECSNCHMYTGPRSGNPIEGLVPTGHTFTVGSEACIGCHQDTVHSRAEIIKLSGEVAEVKDMDAETLKQKVQEQEEQIATLESRSTVRLYTGLAQGAIIGLMTGGAAAWVVSRGIRIVEEDEDGQEKS